MKTWKIRVKKAIVSLCLLIVMVGKIYAKESERSYYGVDIPSSLMLTQTKEKVHLNGYAARHLNGEETFVGVLYSTQPGKTAQSLLLNDEPMAMIFYFIKDDISSDYFSHLVTENMLINNGGWDRVGLDKKRILELQALLKHPFNAGDELAFHYSPKNGLVLLYNGETLAHWLYAKTFFNILLRTWIGPFPPSREFKKGILGN